MNVGLLTYMSERVAGAVRFGIRAGAVWACIGTIGFFFVTSRAGFTLSEFVGHLAVGFLGWFAAIFILVFVFAYTFPPPTNRFEFPGGKVIWLLVGLLSFVTAALVWMANSSQMP